MLRTLLVLSLLSVPVVGQAQDLTEPGFEDPGSPAEGAAAEGGIALSVSPTQALVAIAQLGEEVDRIDTVGPSALLVSGIALAVLGGGGVAATSLLYPLDSNCREGCAIPGVAGGILLLTGISLLTVGASTLPTLNGRRSRLQRQMDDYRRFLPEGHAWVPLFWGGPQGGGVGARVAF